MNARSFFRGVGSVSAYKRDISAENAGQQIFAKHVLGNTTWVYQAASKSPSIEPQLCSHQQQSTNSNLNPEFALSVGIWHLNLILWHVGSGKSAVYHDPKLWTCRRQQKRKSVIEQVICVHTQLRSIGPWRVHGRQVTDLINYTPYGSIKLHEHLDPQLIVRGSAILMSHRVCTEVHLLNK